MQVYSISDNKKTKLSYNNTLLIVIETMEYASFQHMKLTESYYSHLGQSFLTNYKRSFVCIKISVLQPYISSIDFRL